MATFDKLVGAFLAIVLFSGLVNITLYCLIDKEVATTERQPGSSLGFANRLGSLYSLKYGTSLDTSWNNSGRIDSSDITLTVPAVAATAGGDSGGGDIPPQDYDKDPNSSMDGGDMSHPIMNHHSDGKIQVVQTDIHEDREPILKILRGSGITSLTPEIVQQLPTWSQVTSLYGDSPRIVGLDQCQEFQVQIPKNDAYIGPSGLFSTGTNLLADLLEEYCILPERQRHGPLRNSSNNNNNNNNNNKRNESGMLWQVPWGKHNPVSWRTHHVAIVGSKGVEQTHVLPVAVIKDPFHWMESMCRHSYSANWFHDPEEHCPNLVPNHVDIGNRGITKETKSVPVNVAYQNDRIGHYDSLIGLWNEWYGDYLKIHEFPRLMIRFEDILFHVEEVVTKVCECGGGTLIHHENGIHLKSESAKQGGSHQGSNGLLSAITRYGSEKHRLDGMTAEDIAFANENVNAELLQLFGYSYAGSAAAAVVVDTTKSVLTAAER